METKHIFSFSVLFLIDIDSNLHDHIPGGMVRTYMRHTAPTYMRSQSGNGPLVNRSSPIKNLCSTGLL